MGLSRTTKGLKVYDGFGSDTSANYDTLVGTFTMSGGLATVGTGNDLVVHKTASDVKCITIRALVVSNSALGAMYIVNSSLSSSYDRDCYECHGYSGTIYLQKWVDNVSTSLGTATFTLGSAIITRVYLAATGVNARYGTSALSNGLSSNDTTYTSGSYGGLFARNQANMQADWLDLRTSHIITCTGMTTGHYLRVSDGTTTAEAQESSGTATVDAGAVLFPLSSVQIRTASGGGGTLIAELDTDDYADMGGGDEFAYSSGGIWLPRHMQYHPAFGGLRYG